MSREPRRHRRRLHVRVQPDPFEIEVTADGNVTLAGIGGLSFHGAFVINSKGLAIYANLDVGGNFGHDLGLSFSADATFMFSTRRRRADRRLRRRHGRGHPAGLPALDQRRDRLHRAHQRVRIADDRDQPRPRSRSTSTSPSSSARSSSTASGFAGVYYDTAHNDVGLVLQLDVGINFDVFDIITIKGNGQIRLNTTQQNHVANGITINANSFKLHIDGTVSLLDVIKLNTSVDVIVGGDQQVSYGTPGSYTYVNETIHGASGSSASAATPTSSASRRCTRSAGSTRTATSAST